MLFYIPRSFCNCDLNSDAACFSHQNAVWDSLSLSFRTCPAGIPVKKADDISNLQDFWSEFRLEYAQVKSQKHDFTYTLLILLKKIDQQIIKMFSAHFQNSEIQNCGKFRTLFCYVLTTY